MVTLNKIYTRTGDAGQTGLVGGKRVKKNALRVCAYGEVDELNSHIGLCVTLAAQPSLSSIGAKLSIIQNELFDIGAELACPAGETSPSIPRTTEAHVTRLENWIDDLNTHLTTLQSFVLPGGSLLNGHLHIARCVCRRAERSIISLEEAEGVDAPLRHYMNRLSDLLFVMSRSAAALEGATEHLWVPGASRPATA
jgi:cob(I)alamin adenosyltransferase